MPHRLWAIVHWHKKFEILDQLVQAILFSFKNESKLCLFCRILPFQSDYWQSIIGPKNKFVKNLEKRKRISVIILY